MIDKHNFSAGPCILPKTVFEEAADSIINFNNLNLSVLEISHRSNDFINIMEKAKQLVKDILRVPHGYSVLFLHGGASLQFLMVPYNLLIKNSKAAYLDTGRWSQKAIKEAKIFGEIDICASSLDKNYTYIPKNFSIPLGLSYFHLTSNNTIYGTQINSFPKTDCTMVCDMSSDIFSRRINVSDFDLIYAGAQKNIGPAGVALVIIKDDIIGLQNNNIPSMLDYSVHLDNNSIYNTPPVFSIYVSMLNLDWLSKNGGVSRIENINRKKSELLYNEIDRNAFFFGTANKEDRSQMNVAFRLIDNNLENRFENLCEREGIVGLVGHRSVGGYRASIYNAMPIESVELLVSLMSDFEKTS